MATYNKKRQARLNRHLAQAIQVPQLSESDVLQQLESADHTPFLLLIDRVEDPHNLGACLRTADAAGVDFVIAPQKGSTGLTETVRRVACGGADHVPYVRVPNLNNFVRQLKARGIWCVATADQAGPELYDVDLTGPFALVMGAEGLGVRRLTAELCDATVRIPMRGHVDCLNLSVATGVCLFEALRQRSRVEQQSR